MKKKSHLIVFFLICAVILCIGYYLTLLQERIDKSEEPILPAEEKAVEESEPPEEEQQQYISKISELDPELLEKLEKAIEDDLAANTSTDEATEDFLYSVMSEKYPNSNMSVVLGEYNEWAGGGREEMHVGEPSLYSIIMFANKNYPSEGILKITYEFQFSGRGYDDYTESTLEYDTPIYATYEYAADLSNLEAPIIDFYNYSLESTEFDKDNWYSKTVTANKDEYFIDEYWPENTEKSTEG